MVCKFSKRNLDPTLQVTQRRDKTEGLWAKTPSTAGRQGHQNATMALNEHMLNPKTLAIFHTGLLKTGHLGLYPSRGKLEVFSGKPIQPKRKDLKTLIRYFLTTGKCRNAEFSHGFSFHQLLRLSQHRLPRFTTHLWRYSNKRDKHQNSQKQLYFPTQKATWEKIRLHRE